MLNETLNDTSEMLNNEQGMLVDVMLNEMLNDERCMQNVYSYLHQNLRIFKSLEAGRKSKMPLVSFNVRGHE